MYGVYITSGLNDWQIIQQEKGLGTIFLSGTYQVPKAALEVGTESAYPVYRVLSEENNSQIIPWTRTLLNPETDGISGSWEVSFTIPAGGLYCIETGLDTISTKPNLGWMFRGDVRLHIGVGDIFIVAGQSNSSGYGKDSALDPPDINVHLYRNRGSWDLACHPINESTYAAGMVNAEMGVSGTSPYLSFGREFHKLSHYPVGLVITALGGSPISRWDINHKGDLYQNMMQKIKECGGKAAGILWYQGCSDTTPELSGIYYDCFRSMVFATRESIGYNIPFFTFQLNRQVNADYTECWGTVREMQRQAAIRIPMVYILPTLHCSLCDGIHNNSHANVMLGESLARLCANVLYEAPEYSAPDIIAATYQNTKMTLTFANMKRGFVLINNHPQQSGFLIKDQNGINPYINFLPDKLHPNTLVFTLTRALVPPVTVSLGWESDPGHIPILDEVTYMPVLCFHDFPVRELNLDTEEE